VSTVRRVTNLFLLLKCCVRPRTRRNFRLIDEFSARCPDCQLGLHTVETRDPYAPLRLGDIDVLVSHLVVDEPDLTAGPVIDYRDRVLLVGRMHRLAASESVSVEDLGDERSPPERAILPRHSLRRDRAAGHPIGSADPPHLPLER
jgi:hypothetical protein